MPFFTFVRAYVERSFCAATSWNDTASFVLSRRTGNLLYTAGHLPIAPDGTLTTGKVKRHFRLGAIAGDSPRNNHGSAKPSGGRNLNADCLGGTVKSFKHTWGGSCFLAGCRCFRFANEFPCPNYSCEIIMLLGLPKCREDLYIQKLGKKLASSEHFTIRSFL